MKKMKNIQLNGKVSYVHEVEKINTAKMAILPKAICRFSANSIKIPVAVFMKVETLLIFI